MTNEAGRSCQALGRVGRAGLVSESGRNALLDRRHVEFHRDGVLNVARQLGILPAQPLPPGPNLSCWTIISFMCRGAPPAVRAGCAHRRSIRLTFAKVWVVIHMTSVRGRPSVRRVEVWNRSQMTARPLALAHRLAAMDMAVISPEAGATMN